MERIPRNVLLLSGVSLLADLSSEMVYPLAPLFLSGTLGAPASVVGIIEGFAEATASLFKFVSGALSDRWGKRKPFCLAGYGLAALTKPLLALATAWPLVLIARVLDRFGKGLRGSPRDALIADSTPPELRGRAFGFHRSADSIGAVGGPLLALLLLSTMPGDYRSAFLIAFIPGLLSTLLILPVRDRTTPVPKRPVFSLEVLKRADPALRRFLVIMLIFALGNSSDMFLILRAQQLGGSSTTTVLLFGAFNLANVLSSYPAGIVSDRIGRKSLLALGFFLFAAIYLGVGMASNVAMLWVLFPLYGLYHGLSDGIGKAFICDLAPAADRGAALGLQAAMVGVATLPASLVAGFLWDKFGAASAFLYGAGTAFVAGMMMLSTKARAGAVLAVVALFLAACRQAGPLTALPDVSTATFLPAVREAIEPALTEAKARPDDAAAVGRLGMALHAHRQLEAARQCYRRAAMLEPKKFEWRYYLGAASEGREAVAALREAVKLKDDQAARIKLGEALLATGDDAAAKDVFRGIDHPAALFGYGRAAGDPAYYEKALAVFPQYGAAMFALAQSYQRAGRKAEAQRLLAEYERYKTVAPPLTDPLMDAVRALDRGPDRLLREAAALEKQGQLQAAVERETAALALDPKLVQAHVDLISLHGRMGNAAEAARHYREAVAVDARAFDAHYNYGVFCYGAGRRDEAREAFVKALEINPNHAEARNNLGMILQEQGRLPEAAREFQKAIDARPDLRLARFHLGRIYANQQRWPEAIAQLQRAAEGDEEATPTYLYALGATQARAGQREAARVSLTAAKAKAVARGQSGLADAIGRDLRRLGK
jgi:MFS family permease/tetratricopeptide (TPR) repeat protein